MLMPMEQWQFQHLLTVENIMSVLMVNGLRQQNGLQLTENGII